MIKGKGLVVLAGRSRYSLDLVSNALVEWGYDVIRAQTSLDLFRVAAQCGLSLVVADLTTLGLPAPSLLEGLDQFSPGVPVILLHDYPTLNEALAALKSGAEDFLSQPIDYERLKFVVESSLRRSYRSFPDHEAGNDEFPDVSSTFRFR